MSSPSPEIAKGASDFQVLDLALNQKRVLITEDRDFGELVCAHGLLSAGVILVRFHGRARRAKAATVVEAISQLGSRLEAISQWSNPDECALAAGHNWHRGRIIDTDCFD